MADYNNRPIIIKKVKKAAHAHHGGAWKIAYADFVTAMMAFFLLLWLISMTTPEQKQGLADYFAPPNISASTSGSGGVMGGTAMDSTGAQMSGSVASQVNADAPSPQDSAESSAADAASQSRAQDDIKSNQSQAFHSAAASIKQAWQAMPEITEIADNLLVEETPEGLNIQIVDQEGRPMFPEGSKFPFELTRKAIAAIAPILQQLPNQISISGHTAAGGVFSNPRYGPWDLSSDRANVVRSILSEFGLADDRIQAVTGRSTSDPFFPNDPYMAANQRVKITVLYDAPPVPPDMAF
ncbi:Flagellar motor rotation protein MotB [Devosia sp. LC5]|uniref:flagellar motor protein MotB n=1 Tax=Devosia sp. LC5 TaxID=1502724 RepID=UPI0004E32E65|nr:flagellar motor protein MotB [Devosia sp. LC5]KFC70643.1 Flagellar motor rotation protein MotB [Devosia sp. LC5]